MKGKVPSTAQAKRLAGLWGGEKLLKHLPKLVPTDDVLVREGWVEPTGAEFTCPSGATGNFYVIGEAGMDALLAYFIKARRPAVRKEADHG